MAKQPMETIAIYYRRENTLNYVPSLSKAGWTLVLIIAYIAFTETQCASLLSALSVRGSKRLVPVYSLVDERTTFSSWIISFKSSLKNFFNNEKKLIRIFLKLSFCSCRDEDTQTYVLGSPF